MILDLLKVERIALATPGPNNSVYAVVNNPSGSAFRVVGITGSMVNGASANTILAFVTQELPVMDSVLFATSPEISAAASIGISGFVGATHPVIGVPLSNGYVAALSIPNVWYRERMLLVLGASVSVGNIWVGCSALIQRVTLSEDLIGQKPTGQIGTL